MSRYAIPGVAVGMLHEGTQYVRGYGVTNVDYPTRLDGDTVFRVASNTKTFTGTAVMRLVEQGSSIWMRRSAGTCPTSGLPTRASRRRSRCGTC